jgi:peptide/nickel transport system ATP-binding protein/oligopeptide transport system ATP-binding protein
MSINGELLRAEGLVKHFHTRRGIVQAIDEVSFSLSRGETLAIVGESGSGKSTVARVVLRLIEPTAGRVWFRGTELSSVGRAQLRSLRREMQIIFQDPYSSLDPRMTVEATLSQPFVIHRVGTRIERRRAIAQLLERVGLEPASLRRLPHEFSGGQRQRIAIARAIALDPAFVVCDEPVSSLDVSIQAQILNLLQELQDDLGLSYLFISHDLAVVHEVADRIAVMHLGKIVELSDQDELFEHPAHPYTIALLSAVPHADPSYERSRRRVVLVGEMPSPITPPTGCRFRTRCWKAERLCTETEPPLEEVRSNQWVACHFPEKP